MAINGFDYNASLIKAMNEVVRLMNDERAYEWWILVVPDEANDDDFADIAADDEEMEHVCCLFTRIMRSKYADAGWCSKFVPSEMCMAYASKEAV